MGQIFILAPNLGHAQAGGPKFPICNCKAWAHRPAYWALTKFKHTGDPSGNNPLEGICKYDYFWLDEEYCANDLSCPSSYTQKKKKPLNVLGVSVAAQCSDTIFGPYANPFLKHVALGPFKKGDKVEIYIVDWFSANALTFALQNIDFLSVITDRFGPWIKGTVPTNANPGVIQGTAIGSNSLGTAQVEFDVKIVN
jgi:hypothetical protein